MSKRTPLTLTFEHLPQITRRSDRSTGRTVAPVAARRSLARRLRDLVEDRPGVDHNMSLSEHSLRSCGIFPAARS